IQPTYEELKQLLHRPAGGDGRSIQPTYEELKPVFQKPHAHDAARIQPTYEELKLQQAGGFPRG
ncbi:MAG: hypothetical protein WBJ11_00225, partial [Dethiobacteria bacterium]